MNALARVRPVEPRDHDAVLALNLEFQHLLSPLDRAGLARLLQVSDRALVVEHQHRFAGFVVTMAPGSAYDSVNYRWFREHRPGAYYLDRVAVDPTARRLGLGGLVYDQIEARAAEVSGELALEVNLEPPNEASLAFHRDRGFVEIGQQVAYGKVVSMMVKAVAS